MSQLQQIKQEAKKIFDSGDFSLACEKFKQAITLEDDDLDILAGLGICYVNLQDFANAKYWLEKAEEVSEKKNTQMPAICYFYLARIYHQNNEQEEAIEYYQTAIAFHPEFPLAHLMLASLHMSRKELDDAEYHYQYTIKLQPDNADAYANLAQVYELLNQTDKARLAVSKSLELKNNHIGALLALAKIEKREKKYQEAEIVLNIIIDQVDDKAVKAMACIELAHVLDKQGKYDDAFDTSTLGKELWSQAIQPIPFDTREYQTKISANKSYFSGESSRHQVEHDEKFRSPIFFVGFPRSGTTLTEQILNQHPKVVTSDEKAFIGTVIQKISSVSQSELAYPECLSELTNNEIMQLRQTYWDAVHEELPDFNDDSILVDKLPLNIIELGLINTLFPDARILVALRDPRDACLSGFMQGFTPNPAMINFISMQSTVDFYSQVMGLWFHYRDSLPINFHQYRYEDLVSDFENITREIFTYLDLEYPDNASEFHVSAANRAISTPSYQDVATPVYQRSKARWRNYEKYFKQYREQLLPFIDEFGYSE